MEISEIILATLFVVIFPFSWQLSLWAGLLMIVNTAVRLACYRGAGNDYCRLNRLALWLLPILYGLYFVSIAYSDNTTEGFNIMFHKLPILLFPLYFLTGGLRFASRKVLMFIGYCFALSCTALSAIFIFTQIGKIVFAGASVSALFSPGTMVPHHTYAAMYFLLSMTFLYLSNKHYSVTLPPAWNILTWVSIAFLIAITFFIQSRSGVLCLIFLVLWALYDIIFNRKKYRLGIALAGITIVIFAALNVNLGENYNRLSNTMKEVTAGSKEDVRFEIWRNALQVIEKHPVFGIGVGDRMEVLEANHESQFLTYMHPAWHPYNPHNQFLDTWVTLGIPGLLILLSIFILPGIYALRCRPRNALLIAFLFVAFVSSMVESTLERQMGMMFFCFAYGMLLLPNAHSGALAIANGNGKPRTTTTTRGKKRENRSRPARRQ